MRLAIVVSHPIQYFAPWFRELAAFPRLDPMVYFCCDWGLESYHDAGFGQELKWDIPLLEGYNHKLMPIRRRPKKLNFLSVDNPESGSLLDEFQPDVVLVFGYAYATMWRVNLWCRRNRTPLIVYSDSQKVQKHGSKSLARMIRAKLFYRGVDGAFAVGDQNYAFHRALGLPSERVFRGMLPIDVGRLRESSISGPSRSDIRSRHGIPTNAFVLLFSGKFIERKRAIDLVEAIAELSGRNRDVWGLFVGDGPLRGDLERAVLERNLENVTFAGFVNQATIAGYYSASDALVVPSSRDQHPLVVTEAAVFGLPILASEAIGCIGPHDTARVGENALAFPPRSPKALAASVERLLNEPSLVESLGVESARIAQTQDASRAASELFSAAERLLRLGKRRRGWSL